MEIKLTQAFFEYRKWLLINIMRTFILLLCTTVLGFSSNNVLSQNSKVKIDTDKIVSVDEVFKIISDQTDYKFIYQSNLFENFPKVSLKKGTIKVDALLRKGLEPNNCTFEFTNNTAIVVKRSLPPLTSSDSLQSAIRESQQIEIKGYVKDEKDQPLPGATVVVKGTTKGVFTNSEGEYHITAWLGEVLVFSHLGYEKKEISLNGSNRIDVTLVPQINNLEEVIVIAYDKVAKKDLTGAVSTIDPKTITNLGFNTLDEMFQGRVSGVSGLSADGSPGGRLNIRIRGVTSIVGANEPLYVIDGIPIQVKDQTVGDNSRLFFNNPDLNPLSNDNKLRGDRGAFNRGVNPLSFLNINDIESVTVLKDASATSLYGSRASNGVIIITTKRGNNGKTTPKVSVNTRVTVKNSFKPDLLNGEEYKKVLTIAAANTKPAARSFFAHQILDSNSDFFGNDNTNWINEVTRTGVVQEGKISVTGGSKNTTYYIAASTINEKGVIKKSEFQTSSLNLNLDTKINSKLTIGIFAKYNDRVNNLVNNVFSKAYYARPDLPIRQNDGSFTRIGVVNFAPNRPGSQFNQNPVAALEEEFKVSSNSILINTFGTYSITENLSLTSNFSVTQNISKINRFQPEFVIPVFFQIKGIRSKAINQDWQLNLNSKLTYTKAFNNIHDIRAIVGVDAQLNKNESTDASGSGFPDNYVLNNLGSATDPVSYIHDMFTKSRLHSYFSKFKYSFKGKYHATFSARADASSKFAKNTRYGFFPSIALAWNLLQKDHFLTIRASTGITGSDQLDDYAWRTLYAAGSGNYGENPTIVPIQIGNNDLKWETSKDINLGLDFDFFKGKLFGSITGYYKRTDDLLIPVILPASSGFDQVTANFAAIENRGLEIEIGSEIIRNKKMSWYVNYNYTWNKNKVLGIEGPAFNSPSSRSVFNNRGISIIQEGESLGSIFGYVVDGIYQSQEDIDILDSELPSGQVYDINARPGEFRYKDLNGDNIIDENDRKVIGKATPDFYGGIASTFSYKGLSLKLFGQFAIGNDLYWLANAEDLVIDDTNNRSVNVLNAWAKDNIGSNQPILSFRANSPPISDFFVHDASYFRLKSLTLNYDVPAGVLKKIFFERVNIYCTITNLLTFTNYPGLDPETNALSNAAFSGIDANSFPRAKSYTLGLGFIL